MITILLLLVGVAVGGLIASLILRERLAGVKSNLEIARSKLSETEAKVSNLQSEHSSLNAELVSARVKLSEQQRDEVGRRLANPRYADPDRVRDFFARYGLRSE